MLNQQIYTCYKLNKFHNIKTCRKRSKSYHYYLIILRYITNLVENAPEGTTLSFEGGLDVVEDLDKVSNEWALYENKL